MTKWRNCKRCETKRPIEDFYKHSQYKDGRMSWCKFCHNDKVRDTYDPEKRKNYHLKHLYGITLEDYNEKLERQGGGCAICGIKIPGGNGKHFYVDHNHTTGQVRDLLCHNCNFVIGYAKEDIEILRAVARYLDVWSGPSQL